MCFTEKQAKRSLEILNLPINRENLRKVARAKYLLDHGAINHLGTSDAGFRYYHVASQWTGTDTDGGLYTVRLNGSHHSCTCPDAKKSPICKHQITAMMFEHKNPHALLNRTDRKVLNAWIDEQDAVIPNPKHDDFDHFLMMDMANYKQSHLQSIVGGQS